MNDLSLKSYTIVNVGQLVTCEPLVRDGRFTKVGQDDLGPASGELWLDEG